MEAATQFGSIPPDVLRVQDYEYHARAALDPGLWAWLDGPAGEGLTRRWNREAFDRLAFAGMQLAGVSGIETAIELFGRRLAHPVILAPIAYQKLLHPNGECASAMAAAATDAVYVLSNLASTSMEDIAAVRDHAPQWFQLYWQPDRGLTRQLLQRAETAGYEAIILTVDASVTGTRYALSRSGFRMPAHVSAVNVPEHVHRPEDGASVGMIAARHSASWQDVEWLCAQTRLPLLLKGQLIASEARRCADHGVRGVVVSNHGGRCLDGLQPAIDVLPAIADACGGDLPLILDSGIMRGTDVVKALARGARAVMIGRAYALALAAAGPLGVAHVVRMLKEELAVAMAQIGCQTIADVSGIQIASLAERR
ncbi:MAG: alpha-hydroxy-acid oxidizing protein [Hyphomicrobiales bacterium]|nr:alpha-hydroxy-acid oxidizing protein [Hyphomicrobiales bacterium]